MANARKRVAKKTTKRKRVQNVAQKYPYSPPPQKIKYLTDNTKEMTVMARIMRANVKHLKTFRVSKYKGWEEARSAAQKWITNIIDSLPDCQSGAHTTLSENNRSGVVGLRLVRNKTYRKEVDRTYCYWQWNSKWVNGVRERAGTTWQINDRTSEDDAFVLAYLSLEMKSTDRDAVKLKFADARASGRYEEILAKRKMTLDQAKKELAKEKVKQPRATRKVARKKAKAMVKKKPAKKEVSPRSDSMNREEIHLL